MLNQPNLTDWLPLHPRAERLLTDANQLNFILTADKIKIAPDKINLKLTKPNVLRLGTAWRTIAIEPKTQTNDPANPGLGD